MGLVEKIFFLSFKSPPPILLNSYCPAASSPPLTPSWWAPHLSLVVVAAQCPGLVSASNLWYCMFWAGKRGRRSSAGSLESNVEVSRKHLRSASCHVLPPQSLVYICCLCFLFSALLLTAQRHKHVLPALPLPACLSPVHASFPSA